MFKDFCEGLNNGFGLFFISKRKPRDYSVRGRFLIHWTLVSQIVMVLSKTWLKMRCLRLVSLNCGWNGGWLVKPP